ncbi:SusD/RagB family nutrient-binding outer membrane lipoprotein [Flavobacteriaceae bacterium XHP0103]|uniref:SusD/RagB family nutrient-binding outer membrane lipoprotein n=1 Tax=Marixanthotalea marina TaxID=2844359 RepID=UPI002989C748|nr:SusD/RagB family nutrient-binding outer membrane lipoprotein [Marixanthotalea marina]MBU3822766.1 SusD/RagB family nutrient-binding outer membrane lipoprotein [Marixanthotalea marina]
MKTIKSIIISCCVILAFTGCDKGFEEVNTNPYAINELDPEFIFANTIVGLSFGSWEGEATIAQYFQNAYDLGATSGFQFNENNNNFNQIRWGNYGGPIKNLVQALELLDNDPSTLNLKSAMRLWKALIFMNLVDTHGDVPYSEAGRAFLDGNFTPKYDDDTAIYDDLYAEIKDAVSKLNNSNPAVAGDLLFDGDVTKWRRFGNSLLLRLGMRYSKLNASKAASIVSEAFAGGVMQTNDDDAVLFWNEFYSNGMNGISNNNPYYYYLEKPLIDQYQLTEDPRSVYVAGKYFNPNTVLLTPPDVTLSEQQGFPVGYSDVTVTDHPDYPGPNPEGGLSYSQPNYFALFNTQAPRFFLTNSQTKLLLAEAAFRGWISGDAQVLYEAGIRASMDQYALYPGDYGAISASDQDDYIAGPEVAYNATDALRLINTEYWVSNINNPLEGWSNFRRSGWPALSPNLYNNNLNGGFVRRVPYPTQESGSNPDAYAAARAAQGITTTNNALTTRVFWDVP